MTATRPATRTRDALLIGLAIVPITGACARPGASAQTESKDATPAWSAESAWRLGRVVVDIAPDSARGRAEGKPLDPVSFFRLPDGRYVVSDGRTAGWHALLVYDTTGEFLAQLGRKGEGPAEFKHHAWWAGTVRGDSIAGFDSSLRRLQIWSADGTFGRTAALPPARSSLWLLRDGRSIVTEWPRLDSLAGRRRARVDERFALYGHDGERIRTILTATHDLADLPDPEAPDFRRRRVIHAGRAHLYLADWTRFSIDVIDTLGATARTLRRVLPRRPFDSDEREEIIRHRLRLVGMGSEGVAGDVLTDYERNLRRHARWPRFLPDLQNILEDDAGNAWVQHYWFAMAPTAMPADERSSTWSVFDRNGRFLGEVIMPPRFIARSITRTQVLGFRTDHDGVSHAVAFELVQPGIATRD